MTQTNGTQGSQVAVSIPENPPVLDFTPPGEITALRTAETPTRTKQRARGQIRHNQFVIIAAGAVGLILATFALSRLKPAAPSVDRSSVWIEGRGLRISADDV